MDTIIVDFNKIFSALLKPCRIREVLLSGQYHFVTPNFTFAELFKHFPKVQHYSIHDHDELAGLIKDLVSVLHFHPLHKIALANRQIAFNLCHDVDPHDTPYVALVFELNGKLWSGDKKLKDGLLHKGVDIFIEL